jgi:mannose-6-phosphate isomerase
MGSHSGSPSQVCLPSGEISLKELIAGDPRRYLGEKTEKQYGDLPFLFKLLAAERPLSIQAHPNKAQAREGFERENMTGLAQDAPKRNYKDSNHKPEIVCALESGGPDSFTGMYGFREPKETLGLLTVFLEPAYVPPPLRESFEPLLQALAGADAVFALKNFMGALFDLSPAARKSLTEYILSTTGADCEWELMRTFAQLYPGDPAVIAPLYLNVFRLEPGEAVFLQAGILHSYCRGFAVELMANSDNVLRGGLTTKHIDIPELMKVLDFNPAKPQIIKPDTGSPCFTYPGCEEFSLTVMHGTAALPATLPEALHRSTPSICIVTEGEVSIGGATLKQGESAFIPPCCYRPLSLQGRYTLYIASVPQ